MQDRKILWHLLAIITVIFWGTSFVSTKILLNHGFSAILIFFIRFVFTYLLLVALSHKRLWANNLKDELVLLICGITGGTLYFWLENNALLHSPTSNVSLIVCTNPILILITVSIFFSKERLSLRQTAGSVLTFMGMILVVLNGHFNLHLSPKGDVMALGAAIVWVIYSICIRRISDQYPTLFITRKIFFYSVLTTLPLIAPELSQIPWNAFSNSIVILNFLLLTLFSSLFGYVIWNIVLKKLGTILASNYIFFIPLVTMITAVIALNETITLYAIIGAAAIIIGLFLAEYKKG